MNRVGVYPAVSAEHIARGLTAKAWVDSVIAKAGRGKGEWLSYFWFYYAIFSSG